jgi:polysaccharide pyruvyl transferase CsaB
MGNGGDEAILKAIVAQMREIDPDMPITVMSRNPEETAKRYGVKGLYTFDIPGFLRACRQSRLYINGGGSLIQDVTSRRSLLYYLFTLRMARHLGCRVMMYGCGIGPVSRRGDVAITRRVLNSAVDLITLREDHSREELERYGVCRPEIVVTSDPAMNLCGASQEETEQVLLDHEIDPQGRYIAFCLRRWPGYRERAGAFAQAANYAYEQYGLTPLFLSINHRSDGDAADRVIEQLGIPCALLRDPIGTERTIGVLSRMQAVVSMRLHGLIFSAAHGVPLAGVSYDPKVSAFLDSIGQRNYVDFQSVTGPDLCHLIDVAMEQGQDRMGLLAHAARLRELERKNRSYAARLMEGGYEKN